MHILFDVFLNSVFDLFLIVNYIETFVLFSFEVYHYLQVTCDVLTLTKSMHSVLWVWTLWGQTKMPLYKPCSLYSCCWELKDRFMHWIFVNFWTFPFDIRSQHGNNSCQNWNSWITNWNTLTQAQLMHTILQFITSHGWHSQVMHDRTNSCMSRQSHAWHAKPILSHAWHVVSFISHVMRTFGQIKFLKKKIAIYW